MAVFAKLLVFLVVGVLGVQNANKPPGFPCNASVQPTVLESHLAPFPEGTTAWPANCLGLTVQGDGAESTPEACKDACFKHESCSVWQLAPETKACWISTDYYQGTDCIKRGGSEASFQALAGQRIQHGYVNVLEKHLVNTWFDGLSLVPMRAGTDVERKSRCKNQCYSDLFCKTWLYVTGTVPDGTTDVVSRDEGCHLQTRTSTVGTKEQLAAGQTSIGETIEHTCVKPVVTTTTAPPEESSNWWLWALLIGLALLAVLGIVGLLCMMQGKEKKPKSKTRAVKVAPKKKEPEPEVLQPLVAMPVVQQQVVTYAAPPPVATRVVTPTYQAVPQAAPPVATYAAAPVAQTYVAAPVAQTYSAVPMTVPAQGGSVVMPAQGGSVVMPAQGAPFAMEQPRGF